MSALSPIAERSTGRRRRNRVSGHPGLDRRSVRIAHEKALIVDRRVTIEGSYNFLAGAARNSEDLNVVTSAEVAGAYAAHWLARQAVSVRFGDASEWCRR